MAIWTNISTAVLEPGKPARSVDAIALRDNPIAIAEGAVGAPRIQPAAISYKQITYDYGYSEYFIVVPDTSPSSLGHVVRMPADWVMTGIISGKAIGSGGSTQVGGIYARKLKLYG